jgi:hypothetical protein
LEPLGKGMLKVRYVHFKSQRTSLPKSTPFVVLPSDLTAQILFYVAVATPQTSSRDPTARRRYTSRHPMPPHLMFTHTRLPVCLPMLPSALHVNAPQGLGAWMALEYLSLFAQLPPSPACDSGTGHHDMHPGVRPSRERGSPAETDYGGGRIYAAEPTFSAMCVES